MCSMGKRFFKFLFIVTVLLIKTSCEATATFSILLAQTSKSLKNNLNIRNKSQLPA